METKEKIGPINVNIETENEKTKVPEDKYNIIYILFFFLGLVHLMPWTFFTTATEYWMYKFRNTTINESDSEFRTELQADFNATQRIVLQVCEIVFLTLTLRFGRYVRVRYRMIGVLTIILSMFAILTVFVKVNTDSWQVEFYVLVMAITAIINSSNAVFTITMYTTLANFPQSYLAPYLVGAGLARFFTSGLQIISLSLGLSTINSALVYFLSGIFIIIFSLGFLLITGNNEFYCYKMRSYQVGQKEMLITFREGWHLLKKIWSSVVMTGLYLFTTDASPSALVVSEGEGNGNPWNDTYFIPTITYFLAAVCDFFGRTVSFRYSPNLNNKGWVFIAAVRAVVFVPLFLFCNAQPRDHLPVFLPHDYQYILVTIASHLSGGYLLSRCTYNIANLVTKEELKNAYHVNMLFHGIEMGALSFVNIIFVKLL